MSLALVNVPATARRGESFEIKTLVSHRMETGFRPGSTGALVPRDIIQRFTCTYGGAVVFDLALSPAVAANPLIAFMVRAIDSGPIVLRWTGDNGFSLERTVSITVEA
ncbi:MAG TPA: thiosulfate oxidation carrier complex protein SoxZ [Vineibacter sp.]|nr:thiosulfate oxidation carrier complex protein SoxZ [Vineibacter sp.]